jgi:F0F1-type ATP synthase assembly protein I
MDMHTGSNDVAARIREIKARAEKTPLFYHDKPLSNRRIVLDFTMTVVIFSVLGWLVDLAVPSIAPWPLVSMAVVGVLSGALNMWHARASNAALRD